MEWMLLVAGLVVGAVAGWFAAGSRAQSLISELRSQIDALLDGLRTKEEKAAELQQQLRSEAEQKVAAATELRTLQASVDEQRKLVEEAKKRMSETFVALASDVMKDNRESFLALARGTFEKL